MTDASELRLGAIAAGGKRAIARALAAIERERESPAVEALLDEAYRSARAHVIGITGPPGVGKSTLVNVMAARWRAAATTVGIIAVDPSSRVSGGALLGDRTRLASDPADSGLYFRSLAARGRLGGLADLAFPAVVLFRALFDRVLVESVGVGQSEAEITAVADTVMLCVQPGSGDSLQFMKAGIMEIPHLAVVTKADVGAAARRAEADIKGALSLAMPLGRAVDVLAISASSGDGLERLDQALEAHWQHLASHNRLETGRQQQAESWLRDLVRIEYGRRGEEAASMLLRLPRGVAPFSHAKRLLASLELRRLPH